MTPNDAIPSGRPSGAATAIPGDLITTPDAASGAYNDKVVFQFTIATVLWGIVGMLVGVLIAAQLYALQRSAALGLTPDNPFPDGTVNRVVKGVTIHRHG